MGWDGAGSYNRQHNFSADASAGIKILAQRMDEEFNDVASAMTIALTRNGQNVPTQNLPMGGFRHINVGAPTSVNNYMRSREFIENVPIFMDDTTTSADRISVSAQYFTSVSANQAPGDGTRILVRALSDKSSAVLYLNGHSANVEFQDGGRAIAAMVSGGIYEMLFSSVDVAWKITAPDDGRTAEERSAGVTPTNLKYPPGHVFRYGAKHDGSDDTTAYQNASLASLNPYAPPGTPLITSSISIRDNQHWTLNGTRIQITGDTLKVFSVAAGVDDWSITGGAVVGDNGSTGATSGTASGIHVTDSMRWRISKFSAYNIKGQGILVSPGASSSNRAEHGQVSDFQAFACYRGIECEVGTGAEYITLSNPYITRCSIGALLAAGNCSIVGGSISDNTLDGLKIGNGSNHAHAPIVGVEINHNNQYNIHCDHVTNGQSFTGCHIYGLSPTTAAVFFEESKGIIVEGGHFDAGVYNYKGAASGINVIRNAYCPGGYGIVRNLGSNDGHDELILMDLWGKGSIAGTIAADGVDASGVSINDPSFCFVHAKRAAASTQSVTSGVAATLLFNTEVSDRRRIYDPATGIATLPSPGVAYTGLHGLRGLYRVSGSLVFSGTSMGDVGDYAELQVNGTAKRLFKPVIYSTTKLVVPVDAVILLADGDAVKIVAQVTGTNPVHGDPSYESELTLTRLSG